MDITLLTGYARCSTDEQDLTAQCQALLAMGVPAERIYTDKGLTGTNRNRPGLDQALAAVRGGDTFVVPKLDRLARSAPDARAIGDSLVARGVKLRVGAIVYDPADPMGKMFFNILATFAEFEVDLLRLRTKEGMAVAKARGKLKGKPPKLNPRQQAHLIKLHAEGSHSIPELADLFSVSRPTVYRVLDKARHRTGHGHTDEGRKAPHDRRHTNSLAARITETSMMAAIGIRASRHPDSPGTGRRDGLLNRGTVVRMVRSVRLAPAL